MKLINLLKQNLINWTLKNKNGLIVVVFILAFFQILSLLPYINLFLNKYLIFVATAVFSAFFIKIRYSALLILSFVLFSLALVIWLLGRFEDAENLVNVIYVILLSATLSGMVQLKEETGKDEGDKSEK